MANFELAQKAFSDVVTLVRPTANDYTDRHGDTQTAAIDSPRFNHDAATLDASTQTINLSTLTVEDISADVSGTPLTVTLSGSVVYPIGSTFVLSDNADIGRYISGTVTASSAGSVTFIVQKKVGSGVGSDWIGIRALGLLLDASLSETAAIDDVPAFNASAGHWIIDAEFYNSEPLKGMGLNERFSGSGKMVVSYSGGTAKVWAGGQAIHTVGSYTPVEPTHICEGGMVTIAGLTYKPSAISDADAAALATGDFEIYVPFTPSQLFSEGQQGAWYDPSDLATLFQDAAGTVPVTADGDPVGLMLDKSGNGNHASQSTTAAKPAYRTDGTLHWLEFDGVDDCLVSSNPYSIGSYAGAQTIEADSGRVLSLNINDIRYYSGIVSGVLYSLVDGDTSTWATTPLAASTTPFVQFSYADNGLATSYLNGEPFDTQPTEPLLVGDRTYVLGAARNAANRSNFLTGNVYVIITNSERPSSGQRQDIENYLAAKAGVTL